MWTHSIGKLTTGVLRAGVDADQRTLRQLGLAAFGAFQEDGPPSNGDRPAALHFGSRRLSNTQNSRHS